ncbi:MAG TPA: rhodanese-like domain-containing protein [Burkholderiales bacterium]
MRQITPQALSAWLADGKRPRPVLLDVREAWETQTCKIEGSLLIPMGEIPARSRELDARAEVVVICHHGGRSMQVAQFLGAQGFASVHNLAGGLDAWAKTVDSTMPVY